MRFTIVLAHAAALFSTSTALPILSHFQWPMGRYYQSPSHASWQQTLSKKTLKYTPSPQGPLNQTYPDSTYLNQTHSNQTYNAPPYQAPLFLNETHPVNKTLPGYHSPLNQTNSTSPWPQPSNQTNRTSSWPQQPSSQTVFTLPWPRGSPNQTVFTLPWAQRPSNQTAPVISCPQDAANQTQPDPSWPSAPANQTINLNSHVEYSSSMGVLGCKVNTNRIAYFPLTPPCSDPCIRLTAPNGNTIHVLHIDVSKGSYDVSMDAYKILKHGANWRVTNPGVEAEWPGVSYQYVPIEQCADILLEGKMPVIAKCPNKHIECAASSPKSVWATNVQFWDIDDTKCLRGVNQKCVMREGENTPICENGKMAGYSGTPPLVGVSLVVDVTADGKDMPAERPAV